MRRYLHADNNTVRSRAKSPAPLSDDEDIPSDGEFVAVILGGLASGGPTNLRRKNSAQIFGWKNSPRIEISEDDYRRSATPYDDDPLVVEIRVANLKVKCLQKLQHDLGIIEDVHGPLVLWSKRRLPYRCYLTSCPNWGTSAG